MARKVSRHPSPHPCAAALTAANRNAPDGAPENWTDRLKEMAQVSTIQSFWQVFNNTPFKSIPMKDSLHLFKKNVKPLWCVRPCLAGGRGS